MSRIVVALSILCLSTAWLVHTNRAVTAREGTAIKLPAELITRHQKFPGCLKLDHETMPPEGAVFHARLADDAEIYGILCETSAYNQPYAIYLVRDGDAANAERLSFADYDALTGWTGIDLLYNAWFDKKTGLLHGFSKARGLGDCGSKTKLKWDGDLFALMEFRYKEDCDENIERPFPLIYKRDGMKQ